MVDADLQTIIADLLDLDKAEIQENCDSTFVQLGGNSVKALELTFRLDAVEKSLDVETVLSEKSSIRTLSGLLQQDSEDTADDQKSTSSTQSESNTDTSRDEPDHHAVTNLSEPDPVLVKQASQQLNCDESDIEHVLPLTSQQRGLWLGSLQVTNAYISHWQYRLGDEVDVERLYRAWEHAKELNPILRTRIVSTSDAGLRQVVLTKDFYKSQEKSSHVPGIEADEGAPLFNFYIDANDKSKTLRLYAHHALYDRWSMHLILQDVNHAYQHETTPKSRPHYISFLEPLDKLNIEEQQESWNQLCQNQKFVSAPKVSASDNFALATEVCEIKAISGSRKSTTQAELIAAAWSFVCSKHCDSSSVSFGLTVSGRDVQIPGVTKMTFPTFNTMPFVSQISEDDTIETFLKQTKSGLNHIRRTQRLDVEMIASVSPTCREICRFNSILVIQQDMLTSAEDSLFSPGNLLSFDTTQSAPLILECTPVNQDFTFKIKHDPNYVDPVDAKTLLHHLKIAFEQLSSDVDKPLSSIDIFSQYDLQCVRDWVVPSLALETTTLHAMVEEAARTRPDSVALWQTDREITYGALIASSRKVMKKILALNFEQPQNIGVCFEKSSYAIIAMLGVSMAGHAFVPMDAANPFNRLMQLVENAEMSLVVCSPPQATKFKENKVDTVVVDDDTITDKVDESETPNVDPTSNVYIIYTSGSTGVPKGVEMTHQALCTTIKAISEHLEFSTDTRDLQFSSFAFDMSVHDIWCTLLKGGVVCIPSDAERFELEEFIPRAKCNYAMLTPSVALTLSEKGWQNFERLSTSGEPLPRAVFQSALKAGVKFWNTYGPTESCIICITEQIQSMDTSPSRLGYSMAATSWIVDADDPHRLAPAGCVGELVLTGHTLAAGYYKDVEKTENAFMSGLKWTKQFPEHPLDKVYRTGDLARYQKDGAIEFHGRLGGYIKIAGNRVDLGEVEYVLHSKCDLPKVSVQYCKVGTEESRDILVSFCAYPSKASGEASELLPMEAEIRQRASKSYKKLKELLPIFMIPAAFIPVTRLPYNTAGKLDKKRLVALIADHRVDDLLEEYGIEVEASGSSDEQSEDQDLSPEAMTMRKAWATALKINPDKITARGNFFRLGGDSLRAMNLGADLRRAGHSISSSDIFKYPILMDMADHLKSASPKDVEVVSKAIWTAEEEKRIFAAAAKALSLDGKQIESVIPCTSLQIQMLAASAQSSSTYLHRDCYELGPDVANSEVKNICQVLVDTNELLRSKAFIDHETGEFVLAIMHPSVPVSILNKKSNLDDYLKSTQEPLGLEHDNCRFVLLEDGKKRILIWEMHHSIFDGFSNVLLKQQMKDIIANVRKGSESDASDTKTQPKFKDFVQYLHHADKKEAEAFWSKYLEDVPEPCLPFVTSDRELGVTDTKTTYEMDYETPSSNFTSAIYVRAAFALTLSQYTATRDVCFAATNNGRELPIDNVQKLVGPTFSTLPVRCLLDRNETVGEFLSRIQLEAAEITTHQHLSTEELSSLTDNCKQACRFKTHLLIQPGSDEAVTEELNDQGYRTMSDGSQMNLQIPFNLVATPKPNKFHFDIIYNDQLFTRQQLDLFFDQFSANLKSISTQEEKVQLQDIHDLGEMNRRILFQNQPEEADQDKYAGLTIPELIFKGELSARATRQALYSTKASFTYGEMYALASVLSEKIKTSIDGLDHQYIAVCYEKSASAIIAQLAVLMAGHAYVAIDPSWPASRTDGILKQITCPLLITSTQMSDKLQGVATAKIKFDATTPKHRPTEFEPSLFNARPEDAAYVIFTSGTTGVPKGVVVQHEAICRTLSAYAERLEFTDKTRSLLFASFSFDASVMETWSVLVAGGTLCIADDEERISDLDGFLTRSAVDCVGLTPTSAMLLEPSQHGKLKTLLFCGEKCQASDLERWSGRDLRLVNAYGPSETSVNAAMNLDFGPSKLNDIGMSMGGGLWIVDPDNHDQLVTVGSVGELLVTGPVLAKEYLGDEEKTAQKFVYPKWPSWTNIKGARAYKTGDLVQLDIDGSLLFIGRHDGQMKINGIRIEASEIETAASQSQTGTNETAVGTYSSDDEKNELVMFFVPQDHTKTKRSEAQILPLQKSHHEIKTQLHKHLTASLPKSHIPDLYIPVSAIPQSTSGKTDRKALSQSLTLLHPTQVDIYRARETSQSGSTTAVSSPSATSLTATEKTLSQLWTQVLHLKSSTQLTRESHFIKVGGDSVSAIRLSSLARSKGLDLAVGDIYANAVLGDMAAAVDRGKDDGVGVVREDLLSPAPFELIGGLDLSPSPVLSRASLGRGQSDYFGRLV